MSGQDILSELSFRSGLSIPEVEKELKKWRKKAESDSNADPVAISGVGTFRTKQDGSILFTADPLFMELVNYRYIGLTSVPLHRDASEKSASIPVSGLPTPVKESETPTQSPDSIQPSPIKSKKKLFFSVAVLSVIALVTTAWFMAPNFPFMDSFDKDKSEITEGSTTLPPSSDPINVVPVVQEPSIYGLFGEFNEELSGSFTISVFSFSDVDNASEQAAVLLSDGYRLHIRNQWDGKNTIWQLSIGQFETRDDAEIALQSLSSSQFSETRIISYP